MKPPATLIVASIASALSVLATPGVARAAGAFDGPAPSPAIPATSASRPWGVRLEGSLVAMRDTTFSLPVPEVGLTVGYDVFRTLALELTGGGRKADHPSWWARAAVRWAVVSSRHGRHRLTVAAGPLMEFGLEEHETLPFAHLELAYVYRSPDGFTMLVGFGPNVALTRSLYVDPPPGEGPFFPPADEIHAGDRLGHAGLAFGCQM